MIFIVIIILSNWVKHTLQLKLYDIFKQALNMEKIWSKFASLQINLIAMLFAEGTYFLKYDTHSTPM